MVSIFQNLEGYSEETKDSVGSLDTKATATNTKLDTVITHVDGIEGFVDGIETGVASTNTKLDTGNASLAAIESDADATRISVASIDTKLTGNALDSSVQSLITVQSPVTATGAITTQNLVPAGVATTNSAVEITLGGRDTVAIQITGTYTGALTVQGTLNGTTWVSLGSNNTLFNPVTGGYATTILSGTQSIYQVSTGGFLKIRVTGLSAVTGTATVTLIAVEGPSQVAFATALPTGTSVAITALVPGVTATNLGKAEDAVHASGDTGIAAWAVRNDNVASADFGANGDYAPYAVDSKGATFTEPRPHTTSTLTNVTSSATSVTVLALNAGRRGAAIYNDSTQVLYLKLGATASATSFTVKLAADEYYEVPFGYSGIIDGIWASANGFARVTEVTN